MNTYFIEPQKIPFLYTGLVNRQLAFKLAVLSLAYLLASCSTKEVTCDVSGPTQDLSINMSFNGSTNNQVCNQDLAIKPVASSGITLATDRNGVNNAAYLFNGTSGVVYIDSLTYGSDITMSCWVKAGDFYQGAVILYYGNPNSDGFGLLMSGNYCTKGNKMTLLIGGITCDLGNSTELITDANWRHLTLLKQDKTFTLFVNGISKLTISSPFNAPTKRLNIGGHIFPATNNGYFSGSIDDVRVYNRALTAGEILNVSKLN